MARDRASIDAGYIMHGHGQPGGARQGMGSRAAWFGGGAALVTYGLTRKSQWARWASVLGGAALIGAGAVRTSGAGDGSRLGMMRGNMAERMKEREWSFLEASVHIDRPISEVYAFLRHVPNWARVFTGVREAYLTDEGQLAWAFEAPGGRTLWWRGRIVEDYPNQLLSWESDPDNLFDETGSLRFDKDQAGRTEVTIAVGFRMAGGVPGMLAGETLGRLTEEMTQRDLVRLKDIVEREVPVGVR